MPYQRWRKLLRFAAFCLRLEEDARPSNTDMDIVEVSLIVLNFLNSLGKLAGMTLPIVRKWLLEEKFNKIGLKGQYGWPQTQV